MAQHFLLSAAARTLSLKATYKAGEAAAHDTFCKMRWPETDGEAAYPECGCCETYRITTRRTFRCKACLRQFSVTSRTIFASRKMAFVDLLAAIIITVNAAKGVSMVQMSRDLDCQYKTAFVLAHKLREAMALEVHTGEILTGHVEVDGAYFGGHIRPANVKADRVDRRKKEQQNGRRHVVVVMRERLGSALPIVTMSEAEGVALVNENVDRMATMSADEASHWDMLHAGWDVDRVNHSEVYSDHGKHTNWAESYSHACAAWYRDSTTTSARTTCTSMRRKPRGWRTSAVKATAFWRTVWWRTRWVALSAARERGTGNARLKKLFALLQTRI